MLGAALWRTRRRRAIGRHSASVAHEPAQPDSRSAAHADLDLLFAQLADLQDIAADPERSESEDVIYDFSIRWGTMLSGRLQRLDYYYRRGELEPDERERYQQLAQQFRDAIPVIDELMLPRPATSLLS
jgi:hypothetical protein